MQYVTGAEQEISSLEGVFSLVLKKAEQKNALRFPITKQQ